MTGNAARVGVTTLVCKEARCEGSRLRVHSVEFSALSGAAYLGGNYGLAQAAVVGTVAVIIALLAAFGYEARAIEFAKAA